MSAAAAVLGLLFASGVIPTDSSIDKLLGGLGVALVAMGYSVSRGIAKKAIPMVLAAVLALGSMGCTTIIKSDKILSVKQRTFGISVGSSPTTQTPEIKLGLITTVWQMIPTSTNGAIYAPRFFDTFEIGQSANPFWTQIRENTGSGDVAVGTNATGEAIIPKIPAAVAPGKP